MNKPDKEKISEMERKLADSWRTMKDLKDNYDSMTGPEVREELDELQVDMILEDGALSEMIQE